MEKIRIGICDDETYFREQIETYCEAYLKKTENEYEIIVMQTGEDVLRYDGGKMLVLFLDIELSGMDGISVMQKISNKENIGQIVFVSSHQELVWDSFGKKVIGFERKPVCEADVEKNIRRALEEQQKDVLISFKKNDINGQIRQSEIYYIEGQKSYIKVITRAGERVFSGRLGDWEEKLEGSLFIRIHKSYMVNLMYAELENGKVYCTENGAELPLGRKYKETLREKYSDYRRREIGNCR